MRVKHPKKYPVYFLLLEAGIRPRKARKMIERGLDTETCFPNSVSLAAFCVWSDTKDSELWVQASKKMMGKFYSVITHKVETW